MARNYRVAAAPSTVDPFDYTGAWPARKSPERAAFEAWNPIVVDDWPEQVPITAAELDVFEAHFSDALEELLRVHRKGK